MVYHIPKKTIIIVILSLCILGGVIVGLFFFLNKEKPKTEMTENIPLQIHTRPSTEEVLDNALYKRIDFINKLISDFNLNATTGKDLFYKDKNNEFQAITLTNLMNLSIKELAEVRISIEKNGIFLQENNNYIPRPKVTPPAPIQ